MMVSKEILLNVMDGKTIINGDLDSNGRVKISDAILSLQWLSGLPVPINENGRITQNLKRKSYEKSTNHNFMRICL
jgi:hypothetical protein